MKKIIILLKKDFTEYFLSIFKRPKKDIINIVSSIILITIIYGTFIFVFYKFVEMYLGLIFDNPLNKEKRLFELITLSYTVIILVNVIVGVKKIYSTSLNTKSMEILIYQPLSSKTIFFYKLIKIYFSQILSTILIIVPVSIVISLNFNFSNALYFLMILLHIILVPLVSCGVASLISIGYNYIMDLLEKKFVLHLIIYIIILGTCFYLYSIFLNVLTKLLQNGDISYFFELKRINVIGNICDNLFIINSFGKMIISDHVMLNFIMIFVVSIISVLISVIVIGVIYKKILQIKMEGLNKKTSKKVKDYKKHKPINSLIIKEFKVVLRTPSYAFQYFATAFTLPFMVYVCTNIMKNMMYKIPGLALINCDYELSIFVISMFVVISNTFCTTNISRDGEMFYILKTLPINGKKLVFSKIIFCLIVSEISILLSVMLLSFTSILVLWQAVVIFVIASILSISEIMFATKLDLNHPSLKSNDSNEESSSTSIIILLGLITSIILGVGSIVLKIVMGLIYSLKVAILLSISFLCLVVILIFIISFLYLVKGLNKKFYEFEG